MYINDFQNKLYTKVNYLEKNINYFSLKIILGDPMKNLKVNILTKKIYYS